MYTGLDYTGVVLALTCPVVGPGAEMGLMRGQTSACASPVCGESSAQGETRLVVVAVDIVVVSSFTTATVPIIAQHLSTSVLAQLILGVVGVVGVAVFIANVMPILCSASY